MAIPEYLPCYGARQSSGYQRDTTAGDESTRRATKRPKRPKRPMRLMRLMRLTKENKMNRTRVAVLSARLSASGPMVGGLMALTAPPAVATHVMEGLS